MKQRDKETRVLCRGRKFIQAAHILSLSNAGDKDRPGHANYEHVSRNDVRNSIALCNTFHAHFDQGLWWICLKEERYIAHISDALRFSDENYERLNGSTTTLSYCADSPLPSTLKIQEEFCKLQKVKQQNIRSEKPFSCTICSARFLSQKRLDTHVKRNTCRTGKKAVVHTPERRTTKPSDVRTTSKKLVSRKKSRRSRPKVPSKDRK